MILLNDKVYFQALASPLWAQNSNCILFLDLKGGREPCVFLFFPINLTEQANKIYIL